MKIFLLLMLKFGDIMRFAYLLIFFTDFFRPCERITLIVANHFPLCHSLAFENFSGLHASQQRIICFSFILKQYSE